MGSDERDERLFGRFADGDEEVLGELLARHRPRVRAALKGRIPNHMRRRVSVMDVIQDAEIAVFEKGDVFEDRGDGSFRRWYFGIAENKLRETLRRHGGVAKRAAGREVSVGDGMATGNGPSPSEVAMGAEFAEQVRLAMAELSDDYRLVLQLTREAGLTIGEAAEHMQRSREATKKLYGRAFVRFKRVFDEMFPRSTASPPAPEAQTDE
jgi:RNA polymerase sigma factor (sigma-70 family)